MSGGAFCRTKLFTWKQEICGTALLLTQWERKDNAAEYFADLAQETLGGELWHQRLEATVADGEETLSDARFMSCAHRQLGYLYQITVADGWLADDERTSGNSSRRSFSTSKSSAWTTVNVKAIAM